MRRSGRWAGPAAAAWAFVFAAVNVYWSAGGLAGLGTISEAIRSRAVERHPGFVAVLWFTALLKVLAGALGLALCRPWGRSLPRWALLAAGWGTGVLLSLYGVIGLSSAALAELGVFNAADPGTTRWYLFVWEPVWLLGGLLFIAAAWQYGPDRAGDPSPQQTGWWPEYRSNWGQCADPGRGWNPPPEASYRFELYGAMRAWMASAANTPPG